MSKRRHRNAVRMPKKEAAKKIMKRGRRIPRQYCCYKCKTMFSQKSNMKRHFDNIYCRFDEKREIKEKKCSGCSRYFSAATNLYRHNRLKKCGLTRRMLEAQARARGINATTSLHAQKPDKSLVHGDTSERNDIDMEQLKKVLTDAYCDISARLKLANPPKCAFNFEKCRSQHFQHKRFEPIDEPLLEQYLQDGNPMLFLREIDTLIVRKQFMGVKLLQLMLEFILSVNVNLNENCDATFSANDVIDGAMLAYSNILNTFPTCDLGAKKTYRQLILEPILEDGFLANDGFNKGESILMNIIERLEQMLELKSADRASKLSSPNSEDLKQGLKLYDFRSWKSNNKQKYKFEQLKRNEKIDRLFLVLHLLVEIMEHDLAMWMMYYGRKPNGNMAQIDEIPLIASVLWWKEDHRQISHVVKRIVKLFVDYVSIDFPEDKIAILSRLINLMYTTFDLCDNKIREEEIVYPNSDDGEYVSSGLFCETVDTHLRKSKAYDTKLRTNLIKSIQLPSLKFYLISKFVSELKHRELILNPQLIEDILQQLSQNYTVNNNKRNIITNNDDDVDMNMSAEVDLPATGDYPFMKLTQKKYSCKISDREYEKLLLDALIAYAEMHHFVKLHQRMSPVSAVPYSIDIKSINKQQQKLKLKSTNHRCLNARSVPKVINSELENAKCTRIYDVREIFQEQSLKSNIRVLVDPELQKRYREQIILCNKRISVNINHR